MVICEKYNFVYIRTQKTGSTSLAAWFIKNCCSNSDIWTQINQIPIRSNRVNPHVIEKYLGDNHFVHLPLQTIIDEGVITESQASPVMG